MTTATVSLDTVERLHQVISPFHAFIYFCPEATEEYAKQGVEGFGGYFASRVAPLGEAADEVIVATFYNFSPDAVTSTMGGVWDRVSAETIQLARWRAVARVLDNSARSALDADELAEAIAIASEVVAGLTWGGRPLAAANHAVLSLFDRSEFADDGLLRLWQLLTVIREWRGDAHIGLLIAEPLSPTECTVITHAMYGGFTKVSRAWSTDDWDGAVADLSERGWVSDEDTLTDDGTARRARLEERTNELSAPMWAGVGPDRSARLADLVQRLVDAVAEQGYLKPLGIRPKGDPKAG